jgi:hypothetical protein
MGRFSNCTFFRLKARELSLGDFSKLNRKAAKDAGILMYTQDHFPADNLNS